MTHLFIINPAAGSRDRTEKYRENIRKVCDARGIPYRIEVSGANAAVLPGRPLRPEKNTGSMPAAVMER